MTNLGHQVLDIALLRQCCTTAQVKACDFHAESRLKLPDLEFIRWAGGREGTCGAGDRSGSRRHLGGGKASKQVMLCPESSKQELVIRSLLFKGEIYFSYNDV